MWEQRGWIKYSWCRWPTKSSHWQQNMLLFMITFEGIPVHNLHTILIYSYLHPLWYRQACSAHAPTAEPQQNSFCCGHRSELCFPFDFPYSISRVTPRGLTPGYGSYSPGSASTWPTSRSKVPSHALSCKPARLSALKTSTPSHRKPLCRTDHAVVQQAASSFGTARS